MKNSQIGKWAEDMAAHFLKTKGFNILARNFCTKLGEIDIIANDDNGCLVFVEVRFRGQGSFLSPDETVDYNKQRRLENTALIYMNKFNLADAFMRFDVICVTKDDTRWFNQARIEHIIDAF